MIKLIKPPVQFSEIATDLQKIFESGTLSRGPYIEQFRSSLAQLIHAKHVYLTSSATTALMTSLRLVGVKAGDEVLVSDFSFPATAHVVENLGAVPVFVDVDKDTYNMRADLLRKSFTTRTKAVIFVDALGNPTGLHEILEICRQRGVPLIEDAACALGSRELDVPCGTIADITCFSFHPRKILTTGEGGAIATNSEAYAEMLPVLLNQGATLKDGVMEFHQAGLNFRMSEISAAIGNAQVPKLNELIRERQAVRDEVAAGLAPLGFEAQKIGNNVHYNVQSLCFTIPAKIAAKTLREHLTASGVESTFGTYAISATKFYREKYGRVQPTAEWLFNHTLTLPCFPGVDCRKVVAAVRSFFTSNRKEAA